MQHLLAFADERLMNEALENGRKGGTPVAVRLARLCAHPAAVAAAFRQLVLKAPAARWTAAARSNAWTRNFTLTRSVRSVRLTAPPFALETAAIGGKKFLWQLDPYAANRDYTAPGGMRGRGSS